MNPETTLRVAVAEDEPLARERLAGLLREAQCEVVAELVDGPSLLAWLRSRPKVEALFLDIHMPGASAFEVLAEVQEGPPLPPLVFVTAYADHALRAFDAQALDYLLKPVNRERLQQTLRRLRQGTGAPGAVAPPSATGVRQSPLLPHPPGEPSPPSPPDPPESRYAAKAGEGFVLLDLRRTSHFETAEDLVWAWVQGKRYRTLWRRLSEVEAAFPQAEFLRIQRHILLRPQSVLALQPLPGERVQVRVGEGLDLEVSRSATPGVKRRFGV